MFDFNPSFLVRIHPQRDKFHISQGRSVLQTDSEGLIAPESHNGLFVSKTRLLSVYRYLIDGSPPHPNLVSSLRQHSWLGYYIALPTKPKDEVWDLGSGEMEYISEQTLELKVARQVEYGFHEDLDFTNF